MPSRSAVSFGHQRERRYRTARRNEVIAFHPPVDGAADTGKHGDKLTSLVRVCDRRRIDGRPGLELPQRLTGVLIECDELAVEKTGEQKVAIGRKHPGWAGRLH